MNDLYYLEKCAGGTKEINIKNKMMQHRVLFLDSKVDTESVTSLYQAMLLLSLESPKPITLIINSPGGSVSDGLCLIDIMKTLPCEVITVCTGLAASMGAVLLAAGTKGRRYILPHSKSMIHEPLISSGVGGSCSSILATSQSLVKTKEIINGLLADYCGKTVEEIDEATSFDNFLDAQETVAFGLADEIIDNTKLYTILTGKGE